MKRIDECDNMAVLVALLVVGILLVMGAYRIFSYPVPPVLPSFIGRI